MSALTDFDPRLKPLHTDPNNPPRYQSFYFRCPACGKHEIGIEIWAGNAGMVDLGDGLPRKLWHAEQGPYRDWATLSITPSIATSPSEKHECPGWHGFVTNGTVSPTGPTP